MCLHVRMCLLLFVNNLFYVLGLFDAAIRKYQNVDIIVNNAGINNEITWRKMFQINLVRYSKYWHLTIIFTLYKNIKLCK